VLSFLVVAGTKFGDNLRPLLVGEADNIDWTGGGISFAFCHHCMLLPRLPAGGLNPCSIFVSSTNEKP